jgi:hypothetical protein
VDFLKSGIYTQWSIVHPERRDHHIKPNKPHSERQTSHDISPMCNLDFLKYRKVEGKLFSKWKGRKEGRQK